MIRSQQPAIGCYRAILKQYAVYMWWFKTLDMAYIVGSPTGKDAKSVPSNFLREDRPW